MSQITITLPDGSRKKFKKGTTGLEVAASIGKRLAEDAYAIKLNGQLRDVFLPIEEDATFHVITWKNKEGVEIFRHSTAHVLAQAVMKLFPKAKLTIGPVIEEGFFYDFDVEKPFTPEDLTKIEKVMQELVEKDFAVSRHELTEKEAKKMFKSNKYKMELIDEHGKEGLSYYQQGDFIDLCKGPHLPRTGMIKAFKLLRTAGAYWRGDSKNKQLQRIYGVSFPDQKMLRKHLSMLEEAARRNHVTIGERLELFTHFDGIGKGLPVWLPRGEIIRDEIERFVIEEEKKAGYVRVTTPHLAKKELFIQSGHLPYYQDTMYPSMEMDDGEYYLKAMNCPLHHLIFSKTPKSYRDLPFRMAEYGICYRNELSGTLTGLLRVRKLAMNDAHIYCTQEQIEQEVGNVIKLVNYYFHVFGLKDFWFRLSLGDPENKKKYIDEPQNWSHAESTLRNVLKKLKVKFVEVKDEAAFYGPKIDVQFKNVYGREETMSTIQLDFAAKSRFGLNYIDKDNKKNGEVFVIHRAPLSTHERFMAFLIEHYDGKFPLWLAPEQVRIVTVSEQFGKYAEEVAKKLRDQNVRVEVDNRAESIPKKVREAQVFYIPLIVTVGEKEAKSKSVAVRTLDGKIHFGVKVNDFVKKVQDHVVNKKLKVAF